MQLYFEQTERLLFGYIFFTIYINNNPRPDGRGFVVCLLAEDFFEFILEALGAEAAGYDLTLWINQEVVGDAVNAIGAGGNGAPALEVGQMNPRHLEVGNGLDPRLLLAVEREAYDIEAFGVILLISLNNIGHLGTAGTTP